MYSFEVIDGEPNKKRYKHKLYQQQNYLVISTLLLQFVSLI